MQSDIHQLQSTMHRTVLILCVTAVALAAAAPQYRGDGASQQTSSARYQRRPSGSGGSQQYNQQASGQRAQQASGQRAQPAATTARSPPAAADSGSQQYGQEAARQYGQEAARQPAVRAPLGNSGSQQYGQEAARQYGQEAPRQPAVRAPAVRAPLGNSGSQSYRRDATRQRTPPVAIVRYQNSPTGDGGNQHAYETGNGIEREEGVFIKELTVTDDNGKQTTVKVPVYRGSYKYQQPDGTFIEVQYEADETGFHAVGDSIPQALQ